MNIQKNITQYNRNVKNNRTIKFIVIHAVGAVSTAKNNAKYYASKKLNASAHYFCDDTSIWQSVEDKDIAWHCGTAGYYKQKHPIARNGNSIGIEMCQNTTTTVSNATIANVTLLVQFLMNKYNIPKENVIRHWDVVNKKCPSMYIDNGRWNELKNIITGTSHVATLQSAQKKLKQALKIIPGNVTLEEAQNELKAALKITQPNLNIPSQSNKVNSSTNDIIKLGQEHANNFAQCGLVLDGIYGENTKKGSVKVLQRAMNLDYKAGLTEDGIWGNKSNAALGRHTVRNGETQYMVTALEILLMLKGYDPHGLELPGVFGSGLESAVRQYQADHGLAADGIAGAKTFISLVK